RSSSSRGARVCSSASRRAPRSRSRSTSRASSARARRSSRSSATRASGTSRRTRTLSELPGAGVLVIGAGGLGCPAAFALAAAGVTEIGVVDDDVVDVTNLHRQILHGAPDVGIAKAESLAHALELRFPNVGVEPLRARFD